MYQGGEVSHVPKRETDIVEVKELKVYFEGKKRGGPFRKQKSVVKAVDGVTLSIQYGETMALVGESGCGKSTLGRAVMGLNRITEGQVLFEGEDMGERMSASQKKQRRRSMQLIFQDPFSSLNPRMRILDIVGRPIQIYESVTCGERTERVASLLKTVGLSEDYTARFPHECSGGQKQRVSIARALAVGPRFLVADEPTASLDVSVQCQILNLLMDLQKEMGLTMLFISHDLEVVRYIADHVAVMYLGKIVESGRKEDVFANPLHPYTKALLSASPGGYGEKKERSRLKGDIGSPANPPGGCRLHPRCAFAVPQCAENDPPTLDMGDRHCVSCHLYAGEPGGIHPL